MVKSVKKVVNMVLILAGLFFSYFGIYLLSESDLVSSIGVAALVLIGFFVNKEEFTSFFKKY